jgi:hypothetical protein
MKRLTTALVALVLMSNCANGRNSHRSDWFIDQAAAAGLDFIHFNGASGQFYYP